MPKTINPIRKKLVKEEYIKTGGNGYKALKAGGLSETTARHRVRADNRLLNVVKAEIEAEIDKQGLVRKAYQTLEDNLNAEKASDRNMAATALLDFTEGKKSSIDNKGDIAKVIIAYSNPENKTIPQAVSSDKAE